ncbi:hypothetical protein CKAH01_15055 [Colletotrichum kahawae]|uniref:Uncharacterized protein n=1 Tax=Colletotrichum kahawae TaxID=34407 RepID=A0AAD9YMR3_COLKA|nr:hypothetical protein CKAH01_15055 [Colletotrichum kahawae]
MKWFGRMVACESRASLDTGLGKRLVVEVWKSCRTGPACWAYVESHQRHGIFGMRKAGSQPCLLRGGHHQHSYGHPAVIARPKCYEPWARHQDGAHPDTADWHNMATKRKRR